jgi:pimeloyl-ACP methyl ester carboxylesterase
MATIRVNDLDVYYEEAGAGFPVLLIMGLSANVDWWPPMFVEPLARDWRLISFDNRGAGRTKGDHSKFSIRLAAEDSLRLLDALGIERAHVVGMSMGGMIAQEMALAAPSRVVRLVLACTTAGLRSGAFISSETLRLAMRYVTDRQTRRRSRAMNLLFTPEFIEKSQELADEFERRIYRAPISKGAYRKQIAAVLRFDARRRLGQIQSPTLVITGTRDALMPKRHSKILAERIPNARLVEIPESGHGFLVDSAELAAKEIGEFLALKKKP